MPYLDFLDNHEALVLIQTVREKFGLFTERQINRAIASRDMQARVAYPTDEKFKQMVSRKSLDNCSIVANGITNARAIFGNNKAIIKDFSAYHMFELPISRMSHTRLHIT